MPVRSRSPAPRPDQLGGTATSSVDHRVCEAERHHRRPAREPPPRGSCTRSGPPLPPWRCAERRTRARCRSRRRYTLGADHAGFDTGHQLHVRRQVSWPVRPDGRDLGPPSRAARRPGGGWRAGPAVSAMRRLTAVDSALMPDPRHVGQRLCGLHVSEHSPPRTLCGFDPVTFSERGVADTVHRYRATPVMSGRSATSPCPVRPVDERLHQPLLATERRPRCASLYPTRLSPTG